MRPSSSKRTRARIRGWAFTMNISAGMKRKSSQSNLSLMQLKRKMLLPRPQEKVSTCISNQRRRRRRRRRHRRRPLQLPEWKSESSRKDKKNALTEYQRLHISHCFYFTYDWVKLSHHQCTQKLAHLPKNVTQIKRYPRRHLACQFLSLECKQDKSYATKTILYHRV